MIEVKDLCVFNKLLSLKRTIFPGEGKKFDERVWCPSGRIVLKYMQMFLNKSEFRLSW